MLKRMVMNQLSIYRLQGFGLVLIVLLIPLKGWGQCDSIMIDNLGLKGGLGYLIGQSFEADFTGSISTINLAVCDGVDAQIVVRQYSSSNWNSGEILDTSQTVIASTFSGSYCEVSQYGSSHYDMTSFVFQNLNVQSGHVYVIELISGLAINGLISYPDGDAYYSLGATTTDLWFSVVGCEDETMVFGCTDATACNYDDTANVDDNLCYNYDCNGDCGGNALEDNCGTCDNDLNNDCLQDCSGVWGGELLLSDCGCTDASACNYDAAASVDDDSCAVLDCASECGGSAVSTDCGCAGGTTGVDPSLCIDGCQLDQMANDASTCSQSFFIGQSIVVETTGWIKSLDALTCSGTDSQIILRSAPLPDGAWNSGMSRATSNLNVATTANYTCNPSSYGSDYYSYKTFTFEDLYSQGFPVEVGDIIVLDFIAGFAMATCYPDYTPGKAVSSSGSFSDSYDIGFRLNICEDLTLVLGCTDNTACNYFEEATIDDGSCAVWDCLGVCGGTDIQGDACDCDNNYLDALGVCGGTCEADADVDGVCDDVDPCVGTIDVCAICNGPGDIYDCGCTDFPEGDCDCDGNQIDSCGVCGGDNSSCTGCTDATACNYDDTATIEDGSCAYPAQYVDCNGDCINDTDGDGICDNFDSCIGQVDDCGVCNGSGTITGYDCDGNCLTDTDSDGICDEFEIDGCTDNTACNFDASASDDDASCTYANAGYHCDGSCLLDSDADGICDQNEVTGCQDYSACNYDATATDIGSCSYADYGYNCFGECLNDADGDGICNVFEIAGCTYSIACNYDSDATDDDGSCEYAVAGIDCDGNCLFDIDDDGICDQNEVTGCQDSMSCNYEPLATNDGYCDYADNVYDCDGACIDDTDNDGICDVFDTEGESDCLGDIDGDGYTGSSDLLIFLSAFGQTCE
jgi:hypothetical protein